MRSLSLRVPGWGMTCLCWRDQVRRSGNKRFGEDELQVVYVAGKQNNGRATD
jgi:hypothetical protein